MINKIHNLILQGLQQFEAGNINDAEKFISLALKLDNKNFYALHTLGIIKAIQKNYEDSIRFLKKAVLLEPSNGEVHLNLAKAMSDASKDFYALPHHRKAIELIPEKIDSWINYATSLERLAKPQEALNILKNASEYHPNTPIFFINQSAIFNNISEYHNSIEASQKALNLEPTNALAWSNLGSSNISLHQFKDALYALEKAINLSPDLIEAWEAISKTFLLINNIDGAINAAKKALQINNLSTRSWILLGNALQSKNLLIESIEAFDSALSIDPSLSESLSNRGVSFSLMRDYQQALNSFSAARINNQPLNYLLGNYLNAKMNLCEWIDSDLIQEKIFISIKNNEKVITPFFLLQTTASLELQKRCAEIFIADRISENSKYSSKCVGNLSNKIRIGYFSSDFRNHPVGILMKNIIPLHDRTQFEVHGFFLCQKYNDDIELELLESFDYCTNLFELDDISAEKIIRERGIDIAIDLNGHTTGARTNLFAQKIAPIQVNYLGYAGTSGANFFDYLIADETAIPPCHQKHYTEKITYLPHSFFPTDTSYKWDSTEPPPSKIIHNLPESGFIFACFNNSYKIQPQIFDIWMNLLKRLPESILWLSEPSPSAIINLQYEATLRGVDTKRIIFAARTINREDHLSRLRIVDLFLDTPNYNAHATASDALWMGIPVLTMIGQTFAGRVAASQLTALGLTELITDSLESYEIKAYQLATEKERLQNLKHQIANVRCSTPLFNTKQYVMDLETLYKTFTSLDNKKNE